jgi:ribosomal protein S18 acetylase RimI-like enzyme
MESSDYEVFIENTKQGFMQDKIRNKEWLSEEAREKVKEVFEHILPQGINTAKQHFKVISAGQEKAGYLWFELREVNNATVLYIYFIIIVPEYRRRGIAKKTLELLKAEARSLGASSIGLHVFGFNEGALELYKQTGFVARNIVMECEL